MNMQTGLTIKIKTSDGAVLPRYVTEGAAGADICAHVEKPMCIKPGLYTAVPTGLFFEIPDGYEVQIRPRSGLALKYGVTCLNSPGTIDCDYRGEVKVLLINHGKDDFIVQNGDRIAQMIVSPVVQAVFRKVEILNETRRAAGGFGSTGKT